MRFDSLASLGLAYAALASSLASAMIIPRDTSANFNGGLLSGLTRAANDSSLDGHKASSTSASILSLFNNKGSQPQNSKDVGSVQDAMSKIQTVYSNAQKKDSYDDLLLDYAHGLVGAGLIPKDLLSLLDGYANIGLNSIYNQNPPPKSNIYPSKKPDDAPYSIPEENLRAAIQIPGEFSYGRNGKKPVVLVPGTGVPAGLAYRFNFGKLSDAVPDADVVWVNIPRASLNDIQSNAEHVAYAINYISAISSNSNVSIISWSQGALDTQWALKYWSSTRNAVEDFIPISPDFHGTVLANSVCPLLDPVICTPSVLQQKYDSKFLHTLRADNGDSAYVPTTNVYSTFDEIVEPMSGNNASAILSDVRNVGVSNSHLQSICPNMPAGGIYTHEGALYNSVTWALAIDALTHDGPGDVSRIDLNSVCEDFLAPQLGLDDLLGTEGLLLIAVMEILVYAPKVTSEPAVAGYAS